MLLAKRLVFFKVKEFSLIQKNEVIKQWLFLSCTSILSWIETLRKSSSQGNSKNGIKKNKKKKQYLKRRLKMNKNFFRRFRISFWILHCDRSSEEFNIQHNIGLVLVGHPRRWLPSVHLQKAEVTMLVTSDCSRISIFETKSLQGGCSGKNTKEVTSDDNDRWPPTT